MARKIAIPTACAALLATLCLSARGAERLDSSLEAIAKCSAANTIAPSLAAYRLLLSSKVVVKERKGALTFYMAGVDPQANVRIWNLTPTRVVVVEREGLPHALVGSLYSKDFPLSDRDIVGAFQGGLKRKIVLAPFAGAQLAVAGVSVAQRSVDPVFANSYLMAGKLTTGERLLICGSKAELDAAAR